MALPFQSDRFDVTSGGASNPRVVAGVADPSAGGGVAAPEGTIYLRFVATAGQVWIKTGAANTAWSQISTATGPSTIRTIRRTIVQPADGSDFSVTIAPAMPDDSYNIAPNLVDVQQQVTLSCPDTAAGDRTTTAFRVITSAALANNDVLEFTIFDR
jgi:hypothetical protein